MKPVKTRGLPRLSPRDNTKELVFLSAFLFVVAALISMYVAWRDLRGRGNNELLL